MAKYKYILTVIITLCTIITYAQPAQYTPMTAAGYQMKRLKVDSTLHLPSFCGVPTLRGSTAKEGALAIDTCGGFLYMWTRLAGWDTVNVSGGGGGSSTDTTSLSNRINKKIDSLKSSSDSVYAFINGVKKFQFKDSLGVSGTGSQYYVPKFSNSTTLQNSQIFDSVNVGINRTDPAYKLDVNGTGRISDIYFINGTYGGNRIFGEKLMEYQTNDSVTQHLFTNEVGSDSTIYGTFGGANAYVVKVQAFKAGQIGQTGTAILRLNGDNNVEKFTFLTNGDLIDKNLATNGADKMVTVDSLGKIKSQNIPSGGVAVDTIFRTLGKDSIFYKKNNITYAIKDSVGGSGVPYTGATQDVDLGAFKISAQSFQVEGTNGLGHIHFKHQNSNATATGQSTVLFANSNGDLKYKNAGNYYSTLKTQQTADRIYTFQNKSYTLADSSDLSNKLNISDTASMLSSYSTRINGKLNISDTASMLSSYSTRINGKLNISDANQSLTAYQYLGSTIKAFPIGITGFANATTSYAHISSRMMLVAIYIPQTTTITGVKYIVTSAGTSYVGNANYNGFVLYDYNRATGLCTRIDSTSSDNTIWTTTGTQQKAFVTSISLSQGVYYLGVMCQGTATTFPGIAQNTALLGTSTFDFTSPARITAHITGANVPASFNLSTSTLNTNLSIIMLY